MSPLPRALRDALPAARLHEDPSTLEVVATDWTGRWRGRAGALAEPESVEQVAAVLAACTEHGIGVVPQGGRTGLVAGATPMDGEVVLALRSLRGEVVVDPREATTTAPASATLEAVQAAAAAHGLRYGVDLASRGSATLGGTVATNAGGLRVVGLGDTRAQLLGVEAVLADGSVLSHLTPLRKDNTGLDVARLACGTEGILAVVTAASARLLARPTSWATAVVGLDDLAAAVELAGALRRGVPGLEAVEMVRRGGVELVRERLDVPAPAPDGAVLVLAEATGPAALDDLSAVVGGAGGVRGEAVAVDATARAALWQAREGHTEAIARLGPAHKLDVTIPAAHLAEVADAVEHDLRRARPAAAVWLFGHLGDGNVHVNVTGVDPGDEEVDDLVLRRVAEVGGSISAEHGIGRAKVRWAHLARTPAELSAARRIKAALDPAGILNPGAVLPPP